MDDTKVCFSPFEHYIFLNQVSINQEKARRGNVQERSVCVCLIIGNKFNSLHEARNGNWTLWNTWAPKYPEECDWCNQRDTLEVSFIYTTTTNGGPTRFHSERDWDDRSSVSKVQ